MASLFGDPGIRRQTLDFLAVIQRAKAFERWISRYFPVKQEKCLGRD
jgi:hypothetical protein